jgi:hypothetical protein
MFFQVPEENFIKETVAPAILGLTTPEIANGVPDFMVAGALNEIVLST